MQHFCLYLLGSHFTIKLRMDHSSLTWFWKFKEPEGQLARWLERLQEILLSSTDLARDILMLMLYPGCLVINVAERPTYRHRSQKRLLPWCLLSCAEVNLHEVSLRDLQLADSDVGPILRGKDSGQKPPLSESLTNGSSYWCLHLIRGQLIVKDGILWRVFESNDGSTSHLQLVTPLP